MDYSNILELQRDLDEAHFREEESDEGFECFSAPLPHRVLTPEQLNEAYANIDRAFCINGRA